MKPIDEIAERYGVVLILQFGSTVTGKTHAQSDLDLAVLVGGAPLSFEDQLSLEAGLEALHPGRPVDFVDLNRADPLLLKKVTESCRLLYGEAQKLHELKILAFKRYQDHRKFLDMERAYVDRSVRESRRP